MEKCQSTWQLSAYLTSVSAPDSLILPLQCLVYTGIWETSPLFLSDNHWKWITVPLRDFTLPFLVTSHEYSNIKWVEKWKRWLCIFFSDFSENVMPSVGSIKRSFCFLSPYNIACPSFIYIYICICIFSWFHLVLFELPLFSSSMFTINIFKALTKKMSSLL